MKYSECLTANEYEIAIDNPFRLRCASPYVEKLEAYTVLSKLAEDLLLRQSERR